MAQPILSMTVRTPLDKGDKRLLAVSNFSGTEAISQLFDFRLDVQAENGANVPFEELLGRNIAVTLNMPRGQRFFNGMCNRICQEGSDDRSTSYRINIVPEFWLLTRRAQSRIFQHLSVVDILDKVLSVLKMTYVLDVEGSQEPRDFCVQYRETDFNFACRLMEEEGLCYFFDHDATEHRLVITNKSAAHNDLGPFPYRTSQSAGPDFGVIHGWSKVQELRSGKYTLRDHSFELTGHNLQAPGFIAETVKVGGVEHKLKVGGNDQLEIYDYPGEYAQRYDGIDKGGAEQPAELKKIFKDNQRTVDIRMQQEALPSMVINGASSVPQFVAGYRFSLTTLEKDQRAKLLKADGAYVLTRVNHFFRQSGTTSGQGGSSEYRNSLECIPFAAALPFRPPRTSLKPFVQGTQTAVVVGQEGQEIFTDKHGRVKVQFHWDREGKNNANSSCWVRVGTVWAGQRWGFICIPRIGQEVIVAFQEGDPDQPIIIGSVYNDKMTPPYSLPEKATQSGIKSRSTQKGTPTNFNELRFEDRKGSEDVYFHAEKDFHRVVENDDDLKVGHNQTITIQNHRTETVTKGDEKVTIEKGKRTIVVETDDDTHQIKKGKREVLIDMGDDLLTIKMGNQITKLDLGKSSTEAMQSIVLKVGQSSLTVDNMGVTIKGMVIKVEGEIMTEVKGVITKLSADALLQVKGGITMIG